MKLKHLHEMDDNIRRLQRSQDPTDRLKYFAQQHRAGQLTSEESEELSHMAREGDAEATKLAIRVPDCILNELYYVQQFAQQLRNWNLDNDVFPEPYTPIVPWGQEAFVAYQHAVMGVRSSQYWETNRGMDAEREREAYLTMRNTVNDLSGDHGLRERAAERDLHLPVLAPTPTSALPPPPAVSHPGAQYTDHSGYHPDMPDHNGADADPPDWDL